jgi:cell division septum initiation protein DivIVA
VEERFAMTDHISEDVYQRVGDELGDLLRHANDWATRVRSEAEVEAAQVTSRAEETAKRVVDEAETAAATLRAEAEKSATTLQADAERSASTLQSAAEQAAARLRAEAETMAARVKDDAEQQADHTIKEAEARLAELHEAESDARRRIDTLKQRLLSVVEELDEETSDGLEEKLEDDGAIEEPQEESAADTPADLFDEDGEDEPLMLDSEEIVTGGRTE